MSFLAAHAAKPAKQANSGARVKHSSSGSCCLFCSYFFLFQYGCLYRVIVFSTNVVEYVEDSSFVVLVSYVGNFYWTHLLPARMNAVKMYLDPRCGWNCISVLSI